MNLNTMQPDLTKLSSEQYVLFRHAFVEERLYDETLMQNEGYRAIELVLNAICMIVCKKVPSELSSIKLDSLISKIKLAYIPKGIEIESRSEVQMKPVSDEDPTEVQKEVQIEKNSGEKAVVRVLIPKKKIT